MAPLIGLAIQALPSIIDLFDAPESVKRIGKDAANIAQVITGAKTSEEAAKVLGQDPQKYAEFKLAVEDKKREWEEMYLKDVQSARDRDAKLAQAGYRNWRAHGLVVLAIAIIGWIIYIIWTTPDINEYVKGVMTFLLGRFCGYLDNIYNFEFGTTRSSKQKDETITSLSSKGQ